MIPENEQEILIKKLGKRIRELRHEKGISQRELALECEFEKSNVSRLEAGRVNPTYLTLCKVAQALKINVVEIFKF